MPAHWHSHTHQTQVRRASTLMPSKASRPRMPALLPEQRRVRSPPAQRSRRQVQPAPQVHPCPPLLCKRRNCSCGRCWGPRNTTGARCAGAWAAVAGRDCRPCRGCSRRLRSKPDTQSSLRPCGSAASRGSRLARPGGWTAAHCGPASVFVERLRDGKARRCGPAELTATGGGARCRLHPPPGRALASHPRFCPPAHLCRHGVTHVPVLQQDGAPGAGPVPGLAPRGHGGA